MAVANLARVCNEPAAIRVMVYDVLSHSNTIQFIRNTPLGVIALSSTLLAMMCVWPAAFRHQASDQASLDHLGKTVHVLLVELITQATSSTGASLDHPQRVLLAQRLQNLHGRMQVFWGAVPDHDQFQQLVLELVASLQHTLTDPCSEVPIHSNRGVCNLAHALQLVGLYMVSVQPSSRCLRSGEVIRPGGMSFSVFLRCHKCSWYACGLRIYFTSCCFARCILRMWCPEPPARIEIHYSRSLFWHSLHILCNNEGMGVAIQ